MNAPSARPGVDAGIRLGPMVWVPELRTRDGDPWAHRKGEPRPLALLWSLYLMGSALLTLFRVRSLTMPTTAQFVSGCRGMLVLVAFGLVILWPMVRLSQMRPERPGRAAFADLGVLLIPTQAVLWPMMLLTHWPVSVVGAIALMLTSWTVLAGSILILAQSQSSMHPLSGSSGFGVRVMAMVLMIVLAGAAPLAMLVGGTELAWLPLASPLTAVYGLSDAPNSLTPVMQGWEWVAAGIPGIVAVVLWVWGCSRAEPPARQMPHEGLQ